MMMNETFFHFDDHYDGEVKDEYDNKTQTTVFNGTILLLQGGH